MGFDQCLAINLLYDSGKLRSFLLASERPQLWNKEIELKSRWSMNSLWVLTFYDSNLCPERWSRTLPFLQSTEAPLWTRKAELRVCRYLPWIVKLPRLKIGWGAEDCISPVLLPFLTGRVCCEFYVLLLSSLLFQFPLSAWWKSPQFSTFTSITRRESEKWMTVEDITPFQYPKVRWFPQISFGNKIKCAKLPHFSLQKRCLKI